jgi:hypothetical protein
MPGTERSGAETASRSAKLTFGMLRVMTYNIPFGGVDDDGTAYR